VRETSTTTYAPMELVMALWAHEEKDADESIRSTAVPRAFHGADRLMCRRLEPIQRADLRLVSCIKDEAQPRAETESDKRREV
jgi:hypothetical protein